MKNDYSDVILSQGLMCRNSNNQTYCVVIDGNRGNADDRSSLVLEFLGDDMGFMLNNVPNRALRPTGKICNLKPIAKAFRQYISDFS